MASTALFPVHMAAAQDADGADTPAGEGFLGEIAIAAPVAPPPTPQPSATPVPVIESPLPLDDSFTRLGRVVLGFGGAASVAINTPQAVTVLNQSEIDGEQATTVGELFDTVPGVQGIGSNRVGGLSFNIRGSGELAASDESKIIVTVDGATKFYEQYRLGSFFSDPELYKQVEVLRGPASSTLYGSGALGGVINFETKDASDFLTMGGTHALRFKVGYDSNGNEALASAIYATKPSEAFEGVFALNYRTADNYEDGNGDEVTGSAFDAQSGLIKGKFSFGDSYEQSVTASYTVWNSDLDDTDYSQTGTLGFGTVDRSITDHTFALRYQNPASGNPWLNLDVVLSYSNTTVTQDDASLRSPFFPCAPGFTQIVCDSEYAYRTLGLRAENTFELSRGNWENFVTVGFQYANQDRVGVTEVGGIGFHPEGTDEKIGVYVQGEFIWNDRLTLVPGIRADFVSLDPGTGVAGSAFDETVISPKFAAHYRLNDNWAIFGSVAQTERVPTLDEIYSFDDNEPSSPGLVPEKANSVELGFSTFFQDVAAPGDVLEFKATGFYSDIENLIARDSNPAGTLPGDITPYNVNIPGVEIWGVEIEGAYENDFAFARLVFSDVRGRDTDTGLTPTSIPQRSTVLTVGGKNDDLGLRYGWRGNFVGDIDYGGGNTFDGYAVHDLFLDWTPQQGVLEGVTFGVRVDNVLDEVFENSLAGDPGAGRSVRLSITTAREL